MAGTLDDGVLNSVLNANFKAVAEATALIANRMNQDMAQHQAETTKLGIASLAQQLDRANTLDPTEAASIHGVVNSTLAAKIDELGTAVNALLTSSQVNTKVAQSTPPETGKVG